MSLAAGDKLGPYEILALIGKGGMGEVFRARDVRLGRDVAIKILPEGPARDTERRERFDREARAASALNHPNIVTIYEISSFHDVHFIAMEFVAGRTLSDLIRVHRQLAPAQVINYGIQLSEGLAKAHRAGIIHRDIKPSNVMLTDEGLIKILDFGLAKLTRVIPEEPIEEPSKTVTIPLTAAGMAVGTLLYMSPEQAAGEVVGPHSDVFSVGAVLYEMMSGRRPFAGESKVEIMRAVLSRDPLPLCSVAQNVPQDLARVVHRCLEKKPEARYRDAGELAADLRVVDPDSGTARPSVATTVTLPVHFPVNVKPKLMAAALALSIPLASFTGYLLLRGSEQAVDSTHIPAAASSSSAGALREAQEYLHRYDRRGNVDRAITTVESALHRDPNNAALNATLAEAYVRKYFETSERKWLPMAAECARRSIALNDDLSVAHLAYGMALAATGRNDDAVIELERARDLDPLSGFAYLALAKVRFAQNLIQPADRFYQKAIELATEEWLPLAERGVFYYRTNKYDDAISSWRKALQLAPDNVLVMKNLAAGYHMKGEYAEAANMFQQALELDPTASIWANLGTMRYFQGHYAESATATKKAVDLAPNNYLYWGNLGDAYRWVPTMRSKSAEAYRKAISLVHTLLADNPRDLIARSRLATYLCKVGNMKQALAAAAAVEQLSANDADAMFNIAVVYELAHDRERALAALERALQHGYSPYEVTNEPELASLRADGRYSRIANLGTSPKR